MENYKQFTRTDEVDLNQTLINISSIIVCEKLMMLGGLFQRLPVKFTSFPVTLSILF